VPLAPGRRMLRTGATLGAVLLLAASLVLAVDAAAGPSTAVPGGAHAYPGWLAGPLAGIGSPLEHGSLGTLLSLMVLGWLLVLAGARVLPGRLIAGVIVLAHVVFLLAPPLLSADVFGYIGFARLRVLHGLDPYAFGTGWAPHDAVHPYLRWRNAHSPYGPLFTVLSYATVPLGVAGALWTFKALAFAASLATVALVWRMSLRLGRDARPAVVLVGLSPPTLAFEVGGGHNDALVVLASLVGIALVLERRPAAGLAATVVAAALKTTGGIVAPFALAGTRDRGRALKGALLSGVAVVALAVAAFGAGAVRSFMSAGTAAGHVATHSVPGALSRLAGGWVLSPVGRAAFVAGVVIVVATCLVRAWRGADWIACAGWATLAVLCGSAWLLPWYATWLAPLAALGDSRRLRVATVAFAAYVTLTRVAALPL
jgi:hypothetical protein